MRVSACFLSAHSETVFTVSLISTPGYKLTENPLRSYVSPNLKTDWHFKDGKRMFRKLENFVCVRHFGLPLWYSSEYEFLWNNFLYNCFCSVQRFQRPMICMHPRSKRSSNWVKMSGANEEYRRIVWEIIKVGLCPSTLSSLRGGSGCTQAT